MCAAVYPTGAAGYTTSFGVENGFVEPIAWSVGDAGGTRNEWDTLLFATGNTPDVASDANPAGLDPATFSVKPPGFRSGTSNFYAFGGDFGATADVFNHGGSSGGSGFGPDAGTHVIVQMGTSVNNDLSLGFPELVEGHGVGNVWDSLVLTTLDDASIIGGDNASALQIVELNYLEDTASTFGAVNYQELVYEFWLPGYTGDFRVDFDQAVHATIDTLRVDTQITDAAPGGGTPFALLFAEGLPGDYDGSGQVEQGDLDLVLQNWGVDTSTTGTPAGWSNDLPTGAVDQDELDGVLQNWGVSATPVLDASVVPEPVAIGLALVLPASLRRSNRGFNRGVRGR